MNKFGGWQVNVSKNMPQKVASAVGNLNNLLGCEYEAVAYLGSQEVNGVNHAVLMEQTQLTGKDSKNVVVAVFNEQPGTIDTSLVDIHRIIESGGPLGGTAINMSWEIPAEAQDAFNKAIEGFVGSKVEPFVYVGSKMTKGNNYIFVAKITPVTLGGKTELAIVSANAMDKTLQFERIFEPGKNDNSPLGYAFTWLK